MTDERIRALAEKALNNGLPPRWWDMDYGDVVLQIDAMIRLALAERDREVVEWVKANEQQHDWIEGLEYVLVSDLAAFLEAGT